MKTADIKIDLLDQKRRLELQLAGIQGALQVLELIDNEAQVLIDDSNPTPTITNYPNDNEPSPITN